MRWLGIARLDRHGYGTQCSTHRLYAVELFDAVVFGPVENAVVVAACVRNLEHGRDLTVLKVGL